MITSFSCNNISVKEATCELSVTIQNWMAWMLLPPHKPEWPQHWNCIDEAENDQDVYISNYHTKFGINQSTSDYSWTVTDMCSLLRGIFRKSTAVSGSQTCLNLWRWWRWWQWQWQWWWCCNKACDTWLDILFPSFKHFTEKGGPHFSTLMIVHCYHYSYMMNVEVQYPFKLTM